MDSLLSFPVGFFHPLQHAGLSRRSPVCRRLAQKRRIHCTSINGESWLVVYGLPVAQRFLNRNREGQSDKQRVRGTR